MASSEEWDGIVNRKYESDEEKDKHNPSDCDVSALLCNLYFPASLHPPHHSPPLPWQYNIDPSSLFYDEITPSTGELEGRIPTNSSQTVVVASLEIIWVLSAGCQAGVMMVEWLEIISYLRLAGIILSLRPAIISAISFQPQLGSSHRKQLLPG